MSEFEINQFGTMIDSSASSSTCSKCGKDLGKGAYRLESPAPRSATLFKKHHSLMCLDCISNHWKSIFKSLPHPLTLPSRLSENGALAQDDEISRHNSIERQGHSSGTPSPSIAINFPTDAKTCYQEARKLKREADSFAQSREYKLAAHSYISSLLRFVYVAQETANNNEREGIKMMLSNSDLCNEALKISERKGFTNELDLLLLLKACAYYFVYRKQSSSSTARHAFYSKELDSTTKRFIETSYYLNRTLTYLNQIENNGRYAQSPMHLRFCNLKVIDVLTYVETQLRELKSDGR